MPELISSLRAIVGASHVLDPADPAVDLAPYTRDWRKRYQGRARAVVFPGTPIEVAEVVRLCHRLGVALVPQGGNTGLVGGGVPDESGQQVVIQVGRLNRVRRIDKANLTMEVEAGCVLAHAQQAATAAGLMLPLSLASEGSCTIGGNLASNAGGTQVLRYGNAREQCLGLEVVTPEGAIWNGLRGLRKDNTGYDLRDLYIGSEGTLGVITAAVMRLQPAPIGVVTALATCADLVDATDLLVQAQARCAMTLTGFEVMNRTSIDLVRRHFPQLAQGVPAANWTVLIELSGPTSEGMTRLQLEELMADCMDRGLIDDGLIAVSMQQSRTFWHLREAIALAQSQEGLNVKHDISLPVSAIGEFVAGADAAIARHVPGARMVCFGHLGDGNLHYNVQAPEGQDPAAFLKNHEAGLNALVYDAVVHRGGSISAEHGIGRLKRDELRLRHDPVALALMQRIKSALDPSNLMNPGKVL
jgi:FAD/FMN-containing dehydrogenase